MVEPEAVTALLRLRALGWGSRRIARELGLSRGTVKRYVEAGGWQPFKRPRRSKLLDGLDDWLRERFRRHRGNADVVRQELAAEKGIVASLRTVQRAVEPYRQELVAEARATVRFETAPGRQLQIDFGERLVEIAGRKVKVFFFVATLGYSRRLHVRAFRNERQESWFDGMESAFLAFGGVPEEVLFDNPRALVTEHDAENRTVVFNTKLLAFARHWGFRPRACAPYRARTKGKTERGVGYVTRIEDLEAELGVIRQRGYAECVEEIDRGMCSVAAPLGQTGPAATMSIGAAGSMRVFTAAFRAEIGQALMRLARELPAGSGGPNHDEPARGAAPAAAAAVPGRSTPQQRLAGC